jgi:ankyrin repeat protein
MCVQSSSWAQTLDAQDYQSTYSSDIMSGPPPWPTVGLFGESNRTTSARILDLLNKHVAPFIDNIISDLHMPNDSGSPSLQALYGPRTTSVLSTQTSNLRVVYMVMFALTNHMINFEHLEHPRNTFDRLVRNGIEYFNNINSSHFVQILDSLPKAYSQALEEGLFSAALELGAHRLVDVVLARGLDPNVFHVVVEGQRFTPLERACKHMSLDVTQSLLDRGADPNRYFCQPVVLCIMPYLRGSTDQGWKIFTLLLKGGLEMSRIVLEKFYRLERSAFYSICAENLDRVRLKSCVRAGLLTSALLVCNNQVATRLLATFLNTDWDEQTKNGSWFARVLFRALCAAVYRSNAEAFAMLLGADALKAGVRESSACLSMAIRSANMPAVLSFLDRGVSVVDIVDTDPLLHPIASDLMVPIAEAIKSRSSSMHELFWQRNFLASLVGEYNATVQSIVAACQSGDEQILACLLRLWDHWSEPVDWYPGPEVPGTRIEEAFSVAIHYNHRNLIPKLLEAGICPGNNALCSALSVSDFGLAGIMLEAIPDPSFSANDKALGLSPGSALHWAVLAGNMGLIRELISAGSPMCCWLPPESFYQHSSSNCPRGYWPLLSTAIFCQDQEIIDFLLESNCPLEHSCLREEHGTEEDVFNPLVAAVWTRNRSVVQRLISRGVNPCDEVAMQISVSVRDRETASMLLVASASWDSACKKGFGAFGLYLAVTSGDMNTLKLLIPFTDVNHFPDSFSNTRYKLTAFGAAISIEGSHGLSTMELFIQHHADMNAIIGIEEASCQSARSITPLLKAIATKRLDKVQLLVESGASIHQPAKRGIRRTPLQSAAERGVLEIIDYLLEQGADPNEPPAMREGGTALQLAAAQGFVGIVSMLIVKGADINAPAGMLLGHTAFEAAAKHGRIDMLMFLIESGADIVSDGGKQRRRAVLFAKENGLSGVVSLVESLYAEACKIAGIAIMSSLDEVGE